MAVCRWCESAAPAAAGEMYLHGGHVTSWKPAGAAGRSLRQHAFALGRWPRDSRRRSYLLPLVWRQSRRSARSGPWIRAYQVVAAGVDRSRAGDAVTVSMLTASDESTKKWWPADFRLLHRATFGAELALELVMTNTGSAAAALRGGDARLPQSRRCGACRVSGLDGIRLSGQNRFVSQEDAARRRGDRVRNRPRLSGHPASADAAAILSYIVRYRSRKRIR